MTDEERRSLLVLGQVRRPRERADAQKNRQRILAATKALLRDRSIDSICMDAVASAAGVGKGTLYRRFPDRTSLCLALLDEETQALQSRAIAGCGLTPAASPLLHAIRFLEALFDFVADHLQLLGEAWSAQRKGVSRFDHPAHVWQRQVLSGHLKRARRRGLFRGDEVVLPELLLAGLQPELLAHLLARAPAGEIKARYLEFWRQVLGLSESDSARPEG